MRPTFALFAFAVLACSKDSTGAENNTGVVISITAGTVYVGHSWTATVTNNNSTSVNVRAIDCGTQVEKQEGSSWNSYVPTGSICNFYAVPANSNQTFTVNMPSTGGAGTYRIVSAVQANGTETTIYSAGFTAEVAPICTILTPPGQICTPQS